MIPARDAPRIAVGQRLAQHDILAADVETSGADYARRFIGPVGEWFIAVQARHAVELIESAGNVRLSVLDVGGGHGQLTEPLLARGHRVVVHGSRCVCHERLGHLGSRIGRVTSELWRLPFADGSFDLVLAIRLLAHVEAWRELVTEMARVSRALVLVDFPSRSALRALAPFLFVAKRRLEGNTRPYFDFTVTEIEEGLSALGLRCRGVRRQFALPMVLHRVLSRPRLSRGLERVADRIGITRRGGSPVLLLAEHVARGRKSGKAGSQERRLA